MKSDKGKFVGRQSAIFNAVAALLPIALGLACAFAAGQERLTGLVIALCLSIASLVCLLVLKLAALRSGRLYSFGPSQAASGGQWLWWLALCLLVLAGIFSVMAFAPW
ncbi:hypothetical protein [Tahibacter sp.]|uniref:hypothetical protein n=1 Tax=Tahibacter sp. TaxID=2056211 RepID=UPI0028C3981C|nr:hypothetical protein [Tahibacter sp.]